MCRLCRFVLLLLLFSLFGLLRGLRIVFVLRCVLLLLLVIVLRTRCGLRCRILVSLLRKFVLLIGCLGWTCRSTLWVPALCRWGRRLCRVMIGFTFGVRCRVRRWLLVCGITLVRLFVGRLCLCRLRVTLLLLSLVRKCCRVCRNRL